MIYQKVYENFSKDQLKAESSYLHQSIWAINQLYYIYGKALLKEYVLRSESVDSEIKLRFGEKEFNYEQEKT